MLLLPLLLLVAAQAPAAPAPPPAGQKAAATQPAPAAAAEAPASEENTVDVAPESAPPPNPLRGLGRTPEEQKQLDDIGQAIENYESEAAEFRKDVQLLVQKKYEEKRSALAASYEKSIRDLEVLERKERLDAIAQFEEFLQRYPDDARYTPDVMFRLAELYYERSSDDHLIAMREYEDKLKATEANASAEPPPEPLPDFQPSIAIYQQLITRFPAYKLNDAAYYLLGYCLEKQNDFDNGQVAYKTLITRYPKSSFVTEAWVRIGEYYFDAYNDKGALAKAAEAYEAAVKDTQSPLYDKALYKLGWTYYKMDRFDDAVSRFLALADYYQAQSKEKGGEAGGDLRNEALQYAAISLADEKWGSLDRAKAVFAKLGPRPYEAEVYKKMGDVFFDQTRHGEAVAAYQLALAKNPTMDEAPFIQQRIVEAYERDRKLDEAFKESEKLATSYGPGTAWYDKHKRDPDFINQVQALAEKSLYGSAVYHHQQALALKQQGKLEEAKAAFETAARAYSAYLQRYPRSKNAYEVQFFAAECQYNSLQFAAAAKNYDAVRNSTADSRYTKDAAFNAVLAWQKLLEQLQRDKKLAVYPVLRSKDRPEGEKVKVLPLAEVETQFIAASDAYVAAYGQEDKAPGVAYKAAELFYAHNNFPESRKRFEQIIQSYPRNEVAKFATNLIVESYLVDKDWKSVEEVSARLAQNSAVIDPKSDLYKDLNKFKLAGRFKLADELMAKGDYEQAAKKYIELVDEDPKNEFADKALNNAAVCYENTRRFESALKLYERIFREYPNSKLADAALFRVAVNAENSYDFDKAVENYQRLVKDYPASKNREAALFNAGRLLEGQQRYRDAAQTFTRYVELFPNAEDAPKNQYRAALLYEKQGDPKGEIKALEAFVKKFSSKPQQAELVVDAKKRIGEAYQKLGDERAARRAFEEAAREFDRRGLKPEAAPLAAEAAAQARFQLAEYEFKEFDKVKIGGRGKALEKSFTVKRAAVKKVNDAYGEVFKYKRLEWTLASLYRKGFALERFGQTILETPTPPEVKRLGDEAVASYQDQLQQQTAALEDKAVESYVATLTEARKNRINDEWTKRTLEALNRYRPKEYPVLKEPKSSVALDVTHPDGLVVTLEGKPPPPDAAPAGKLPSGGDK
ncbi:MAG: tetratricopeptide repeat protein [Myxococcaceae bacterium]